MRGLGMNAIEINTNIKISRSFEANVKQSLEQYKNATNAITQQIALDQASDWLNQVEKLLTPIVQPGQQSSKEIQDYVQAHLGWVNQTRTWINIEQKKSPGPIAPQKPDGTYHAFVPSAFTRQPSPTPAPIQPMPIARQKPDGTYYTLLHPAFASQPSPTPAPAQPALTAHRKPDGTYGAFVPSAFARQLSPTPAPTQPAPTAHQKSSGRVVVGGTDVSASSAQNQANVSTHPGVRAESPPPVINGTPSTAWYSAGGTSSARAPSIQPSAPPEPMYAAYTSEVVTGPSGEAKGILPMDPRMVHSPALPPYYAYPGFSPLPNMGPMQMSPMAAVMPPAHADPRIDIRIGKIKGVQGANVVIGGGGATAHGKAFGRPPRGNGSDIQFGNLRLRSYLPNASLSLGGMSMDSTTQTYVIDVGSYINHSAPLAPAIWVSNNDPARQDVRLQINGQSWTCPPGDFVLATDGRLYSKDHFNQPTHDVRQQGIMQPPMQAPVLPTPRTPTPPAAIPTTSFMGAAAQSRHPLQNLPHTSPPRPMADASQQGQMHVGSNAAAPSSSMLRTAAGAPSLSAEEITAYRAMADATCRGLRSLSNDPKSWTAIKNDIVKQIENMPPAQRHAVAECYKDAIDLQRNTGIRSVLNPEKTATRIEVDKLLRATDRELQAQQPQVPPPRPSQKRF